MSTHLNWQKIYQDYSPKLLGICRRYVSDLPTAEDLLQDSFIVGIQKSQQLKNQKALFGWLKTIVINNALQHLRNHNKEFFVSSDTIEISESLLDMNTIDIEKNHIFSYDFSQEELLKSIDNLPTHHKTVFNLYCLENHSHAEIAQLLDININTSKSHLSRAKKSIQHYLLNNIITPNTPKNKRKLTTLLIFFGFGSFLWAKTFQNKFSVYQISPTKQLEIPENIEIRTNYGFQISSSTWIIKLVLCSSILIIIFCLILWTFKQNPIGFNGNLNKNEKSAIIKEEIVNTNVVIQTTEHNATPTFDNHKMYTNITKKSESLPNLKEEKNNVTQVIVKKDSTESHPKKVIIVKKIIQRDTIFIEREN